MMCSSAVVCAVESILFGGKERKCDQDAEKSNFTTKCRNTFVARCRFCYVFGTTAALFFNDIDFIGLLEKLLSVAGQRAIKSSVIL